MAATNEQVQVWSNERTRVRAEQVRSLMLAMEGDNGAIGEVYANLTDNPTWDDNRPDAPANLVPGDVLAINTVSVQLAKILRGQLANDAEKVAACNDVAAQLPVVLKACVRPVQG